MKLPRIRSLSSFRMGRPQRWAALLLLVLLAECSWVIAHQTLSNSDYRYARCGREMWERPSPLAGYFTTCGNLNGDGIFAYRLAGFPLTAQRLLLLGRDQMRQPQDRLYTGSTLNGSTWEARHQITSVRWLMHLPFVLFAAWLGAGLWWVARRIFGNEGGFLALALYIFCPAVVASAVRPNNEVLAMWGLYGLIYTAIGVAHALQGPRSKWRPRILLLIAALGLTAAAHLLAAMFGFLASLILMFYLAERRRSAVLLVVTYSAIGALLVEFAFFSFRPAPFSYIFTGGGGRFWFSTLGVRSFAHDQSEWPILIAAAVALIVWLGSRRSRYFGNTAPLLLVLGIVFLQSTQIFSAPSLWALPFLFTFIGGVFADALESRQRKLFLATSGLLIGTQAIACIAQLSSLARG